MRKGKPRGLMARYNCDACGKDFTARVADRNRGWARFCSKTCKAKKLDSAPAKPKAKDYPNERDCEHGRQRGKCESCDLAQAEQRITELQSLLQERDAWIERVCKNGRQVVEEITNRTCFPIRDLKVLDPALRDLSQALNQAPQQNLNAVKREVYADGYYDGYRMAWLHDHDSKADHDEYASEQSEIESEKLYPSVKDGE